VTLRERRTGERIHDDGGKNHGGKDKRKRTMTDMKGMSGKMYMKDMECMRGRKESVFTRLGKLSQPFCIWVELSVRYNIKYITVSIIK
jgi:hypothetical protein